MMVSEIGVVLSPVAKPTLASSCWPLPSMKMHAYTGHAGSRVGSFIVPQRLLVPPRPFTSPASESCSDSVLRGASAEVQIHSVAPSCPTSGIVCFSVAKPFWWRENHSSRRRP